MNRPHEEKTERQQTEHEALLVLEARSAETTGRLPPGVLRVQVTNLRNLVFWAFGVYLLLNFMDSIVLVLLLFTLGLFLAIALEPGMRWLSRRGVSRGVACGLLVLLLVAVGAVTLILAIPPIAEQANAFFSTLPEQAQRLQDRIDSYIHRYPALEQQLDKGNMVEQVTRWGQNALPQIGRYSLTIANGVLGLGLVFIIALYTLVDPKPLLRGVVHAFPRAQRFTVLRIVSRLLHQYQSWARAVFWLMLIIGALSGVGLQFIGVQNVLVFAVIAGILEVIPVVGPLLSAVPPILVTLAVDPTKALWVAALYTGIQFVENYLLVPRIMGSTLDLHPVSVLFSVAALGALFGPPGILLATPFCTTVKILYQEVYQRRMLGGTSESRRRGGKAGIRRGRRET